MCPYVNFQYFRIFRVGHHRGRLSTDRADQRFFRQRDELFRHRQVRIVAPTVTGMTVLRTAFLGSRSDPLGIEQIVRAMTLGRLLRLTAKEFVLQCVDLATRLLKLLFQLHDALDGLGVLTFPIADLAAEISLQLFQRPLQPQHGRAVGAGSRWLRRLAQRFQKRGIHKATL
jgi:hypothetical protein